MQAFLQKILNPFSPRKVCPRCQARAMECYHSRPAQRNHLRPLEARAFYRCHGCGARYMQQDGQWIDASGADYDPFYNMGKLHSQQDSERLKRDSNAARYSSRQGPKE